MKPTLVSIEGEVDCIVAWMKPQLQETPQARSECFRSEFTAKQGVRKVRARPRRVHSQCAGENAGKPLERDCIAECPKRPYIGQILGWKGRGPRSGPQTERSGESMQARGRLNNMDSLII